MEKPELSLHDTDGNAFVLLAKARRVAKDHHLNWDVIYKEATASDYDNLLQTLMAYFDVTT